MASPEVALGGAGAVPGLGGEGRRGVQVPGHCLQQSEGLARTGLAQVSRGHCTFSQCTSPVVPCGERGGSWRYRACTPPLWFEPLLQCLAAQDGHHGCQNRVGAWGANDTRTHTHLAGANGTFDEAKGGHDGVPAGARASPCLVPVKVAAWERRRRRWAQPPQKERGCWGGWGGRAAPSGCTRWDSPSLLSRARSSFSSSCPIFFSARKREATRERRG